MTYIQPGDEVRVFPSSRRIRTQYPEGFPGTVTSVGRKYAKTEFERPSTFGPGVAREEISFDMTNGEQRAGSEYYVRTPEQIERDKRREVALFYVKGAGIEFSFGRERSFTTEQLEALAEVVKTWEA